MALWYHFAIMFRSAVHPHIIDAGTRVGRLCCRTRSDTSGNRQAHQLVSIDFFFTSAVIRSRVGKFSCGKESGSTRRH